ncbi:MAG: AI-2E family transporter [Bacteroidia bacterium]
MDNSFKIPFYAKAALISISVFAFVYTMYAGQVIIIPIVFATIVAILLNPLVNYLLSKKINKIVAIAIAVLFAICLVFGLLYVISSQLHMFREIYPQLKGKFNTISTQFLQWVSTKFSVKELKIDSWISDTKSKAVSDFAIGDKLSEAAQMMVIGALLPVYLFMILYYKPLLMEFTRRLFRVEYHTAVTEVLTNSRKIIQSYLVGLFIEFIIIAILNSVGLLLLGIDYAIILGITGAILNVIPYIGGIIAIALPMIIAFVTKDSLIYTALVFVVYIFIQFIDNHYVIPKIVASRVQLNALLSVIVVLIGGAVWGIPGMFLSIPLTAIIKVIFDHIEPLKPLGFLLGNIVPTASKLPFVKQRKKTLL